MSDDAEWSKAERLVVAGALAPRLRSQDEKVSGRRVALTDKDGKVTGYTTLGEVQRALLRERQIELETIEGVRPTEVVCRHCGKTITVKRGPGPVPKVCKDGCDRRCATEGCDGILAKITAYQNAQKGTKGVCRKCRDASNGRNVTALRKSRGRTHAERSTASLKGAAAMTPEQRSERMRKAWATRRRTNTSTRL
jgi:hypothetical protein